MKNKITNAIVYSNLLISLGAAALCTQVFLLNDLEINLFYISFVFCSTMVSYNLQRLVKVRDINKNSPVSWVVNHTKTLWIISGIAMFFSLVMFAKFFSNQVIYWLIPLAIISIFYTYKGLRNIPYIKIFLISTSWAIACGVIPFIVSEEIYLNQIIINFILIFTYIFSITIPFDIRDKKIDEDSKKTIPQIVGVKNAKTIALILLSIYLLLSIFNFPFYTIPLLISVIFAGGLIYFSDEKKEDLYYSFWIDGHIIFQFFGVLLIYLTKYV